MSELFKRAAVFTDLHHGAKSNSDLHNQDCHDFINWFIQTSIEHNCDTCLFLGDLHHNRNNMNMKTMDYIVSGMEMLGKAFSQFFFLLGNHDLFYKDARTVHSVLFGHYIPGITIIDKPTVMDNVILCPWLIGDEWKTIKKQSGEYIFGHFELPHFLMNSTIKMPDTGTLDHTHFKRFTGVYSGHFHKRQTINNIHYIGNAFPHNFSDAGDNTRGMMILEWGKPHEYYTWDGQPTFDVISLSTLLEKPDQILIPKKHIRAIMDIDINFEEATTIKETLIETYQLRELMLIPRVSDLDSATVEFNSSLQTVDQIVSDGISGLESESFDTTVLMDIYNSL